MKSAFFAKVKNGQLDFEAYQNVARFRDWCANNEGARLLVSHVTPKRSMSQSRYYWVYLEAISHETGHSAEELHFWAKTMFLTPAFATVLGKEVMLMPSTKELSKAEFAEFLDRICAETGVALPNPQEAGFISNY